ncbi:MAG: DUF3592 domain-containing protein [Legionella sp.]
MIWLKVWRWMLDLGWLLFLLILFCHFWCDLRGLARARSWLKVKGRITACEWTTVGHSVWPKIQYLYRVNDREITGEYLFLDTAHNNPNSKYSRKVAYNAAVAFKDEAEVDVYYNPNNPEQSALDVTMPIKLNIILILIGMLFIVHLGLIVWRIWAG